MVISQRPAYRDDRFSHYPVWVSGHFPADFGRGGPWAGFTRFPRRVIPRSHYLPHVVHVSPYVQPHYIHYAPVSDEYTTYVPDHRNTPHFESVESIAPEKRSKDESKRNSRQRNESKKDTSERESEKKPCALMSIQWENPQPRKTFTGRRTEEGRDQNQESQVYFSDSSYLDGRGAWENREGNDPRDKKETIPEGRFVSVRPSDGESSSGIESVSSVEKLNNFSVDEGSVFKENVVVEVKNEFAAIYSKDDEINTFERVKSYRQTFGETSQGNDDRIDFHIDSSDTDEDTGLSSSSSEELDDGSSGSAGEGASTGISDERSLERSRSPARWLFDTPTSPDPHKRKISNLERRRLNPSGTTQRTSPKSPSSLRGSLRGSLSGSLRGRRITPKMSNERSPGSSRGRPKCRDSSKRNPGNLRMRRRRSRSLTRKSNRSLIRDGSESLSGRLGSSIRKRSRSNDGSYDRKFQKSEGLGTNPSTSSERPYQRSMGCEKNASTCSERPYQRSETFNMNNRKLAIADGQQPSTSSERPYQRSIGSEENVSTSSESPYQRSETFKMNNRKLVISDGQQPSTSSERPYQRSQTFKMKNRKLVVSDGQQLSTSSERPYQRSIGSEENVSTSSESPYQRSETFKMNSRKLVISDGQQPSTSSERPYQRSQTFKMKNRKLVVSDGQQPSTSSERPYQRSMGSEENVSTSSDRPYQRSMGSDENASTNSERPHQRSETFKMNSRKLVISDGQQPSTSSERPYQRSQTFKMKNRKLVVSDGQQLSTSSERPYQRSMGSEENASTSSERPHQRSETFKMKNRKLVIADGQQPSTSSERPYQRSIGSEENVSTSSESPYQRSETFKMNSRKLVISDGQQPSTSNERPYQRSETFKMKNRKLVVSDGQQPSTSGVRPYQRSTDSEEIASTSNERPYQRSETSMMKNRKLVIADGQQPSTSNERPYQRSDTFKMKNRKLVISDGQQPSTSGERPYQRSMDSEEIASTSNERPYQRSETFMMKNRKLVISDGQQPSTSGERPYQRSMDSEEIASTSSESPYQRSENVKMNNRKLVISDGQQPSTSGERPYQRSETVKMNNRKLVISDGQQPSTSGVRQTNTALGNKREGKITSNNAGNENAVPSNLDLPSCSHHPIPEMREGGGRGIGGSGYKSGSMQVAGYYPLIGKGVDPPAPPKHTRDAYGREATIYETHVLFGVVPRSLCRRAKPVSTGTLPHPLFGTPSQVPTPNVPLGSHQRSPQIENSSRPPVPRQLELVRSVSNPNTEPVTEGLKSEPREKDSNNQHQMDQDRGHRQVVEWSFPIINNEYTDGEGRALPKLPFVPPEVQYRIDRYRNPQPKLGEDGVELIPGPNGLPVHISPTGKLTPYDLEGRRIAVGPDNAYIPVDMAGRIYPHLVHNGVPLPVHLCEEGILRTPDSVPIRVGHPDKLPVSILGTYIQLDSDSRPVGQYAIIPSQAPVVVNQDRGIPSPKHELELLAGKTYLEELRRARDLEANGAAENPNRAAAGVSTVSDSEERNSIYSRSTENDSSRSPSASVNQPKPAEPESTPAVASTSGLTDERRALGERRRNSKLVKHIMSILDSLKNVHFMFIKEGNFKFSGEFPDLTGNEALTDPDRHLLRSLVNLPFTERPSYEGDGSAEPVVTYDFSTCENRDPATDALLERVRSTEPDDDEPTPESLADLTFTANRWEDVVALFQENCATTTEICDKMMALMEDDIEIDF